MTARALGGLLLYNALILGLGAGVLWGIRGWRWWTDLARLVGVAYLLGTSALMLLVTYGIVLGVPVTGSTLLLSGAGVVGVGVLVGRLRGFAAPGIRPPGWRFPPISFFAALFAAGIVVYFEALFRANRLAGVAREWDSWANWLPKSKSLYLTGQFDLDFLAGVPQILSYPPGPAAIQAGAFHAMGSADTTTLHVHYWFMAAGFVAAVVGVLWRRVHHAILFPIVLALLVAPSVVDWITTVYADLPMGYLIAVAGVLLVLWIEDKQPWQLGAAVVLVAGAMVTKREGIIFAACLLLAAFVASLADRHPLWKRLFAAAAIALVLVLPWSIWFVAQGASVATTDTQYDGPVSDVDRLWPALEITVRSMFHTALWQFTSIILLAAIVLALLAGAWRSALFAGTLFVSSIAAVTWLLWVNRSLVLDHDEWAIRRLLGTTFLAIAALTPLLLERAWRSSASATSTEPVALGTPDVLFRPSRLAWVVVLVGLLSHPGSALVGYSGSALPGGWPSFPSCVVDPSSDTPMRVVVGYTDTHVEASSLRERARLAGLDARVAQDGCGRLRVSVDDVPTMDGVDALVAEAQAAGLRPTVEGDKDE